MENGNLVQKNNIYLNKQQEIAVNSIQGATLLLAVPGSGKTTVIIHRIGNMIYNHKIPARNILTLTFSVTAAKNMKERFSYIFGSEYADQLQFRTIHSFSFMIIREYERLKGTKAFNIIENNIQILKKIYYEKYKKYESEEMIQNISQKISFCKNSLNSKEEIKSIKFEDCDFSYIYEKYESYKKENKLMDYDDLLIYAFIILTNYPDLLLSFQNQFIYINVDEAQDTSLIQHEIIRLLANKNKNIFMVGDEDQCIYGFRAASPKELLNFEKYYNDARVLKMEQNFRSTKKIVETANKLIKQNKNRYNKDMFCDNEEGYDIKKTYISDYFNQNKIIIDSIKNIGISSNIAVVYRNNDSAISLVNALETEGIPYSIKENSTTFFTHFIVNDIINFMKVALNFKDIKAFQKIYYKMKYYVNKQMVEYVHQNFKDDIFETLLTNIELKSRNIIEIINMQNDFIKLKSLPPFAAIDYIINNMGYKYSNNSPLSEDYSLDPLNQKIRILLSIALNETGLINFLDRLDELDKKMKSPVNKGEKVVLTTIHSSKGLEFDKVILIDLIDGIFPTLQSIQKNDEGSSDLYEEEVRLFYVALTRAKKEIELLIPNNNSRYKIIRSQLTRFLFKKYDEIDKGKKGEPNYKFERKVENEPVKVNKSISKTFNSYTKPIDLNIKEFESLFKANISNKKIIITNEEIKKFNIGTEIKHRMYGEGTICNFYGGGSVEVNFSSKGKKKILLTACLEDGTVQFIK